MTTKGKTSITLNVQERNGAYRPASPDEIIHAAQTAISRRFRRGKALTSPADSIDFMKLKLSHLEHEIFAVLWLDNRHRVIAFEELFRGTIDGASIYTREVVKSALTHNAAACIIAHNHPSGVCDPSQADRTITKKIIDTLSLIDIRVLDHIVIGENAYSFAEHGLI